MKKILSIILIFVVLLSVFSLPAKAIAVEVIGGSYVAYAILAAALAAAGYTVATSDVSPEIFQGILDSPNAELIKALIGGTTMYATAKGSVYFNWTAGQWAIFTNWISQNIANGLLTFPASVASELFVDTFDVTQISSYYEKYIPTTSGIIGYSIAGGTVVTVENSSRYRGARISLANGAYLVGQNNGTWINDFNQGVYMFGSPIINTLYGPKIIIGMGMRSNNNVAYNRNDIVKCSKWLEDTLNHIIYAGYNFTISLVNGNIIASASNMTLQITGTALFPDTYSSVMDYFTDVINTGSLIGDWTGIGDDVINPAYPETEVGIDSYPDYQVGTGTDALPLDLDIGSSIDIPLDRWIDTPIDLSQDPVPIDFTDWPDRTIDNTPSDVVPDVRVNPTTDIPSNPDIPWADTDSYPIDYPIDTDTPLLPDSPNPDTPPQGDDSNKMKLLPLILSKFPFCLPWDLYHGVNSFFVTAEAPVFDIPLRSQAAGINETIHIDFNNYQTLASVSRWFFSALWVIILILITRKIVWK